MEPIESQPTRICHVVALPYPGRGHVNPMLHLCNLLLRRNPNLFITFVVTDEWLRLISAAADHANKPQNLRFATLPNLIPSELVRANDFLGFVDAVHTRLEEPFERLLDRLDSPPPAAIIADTYVVWAVAVGQRRNIPVASFWTMSATILSVFLHSDLLVHFPAEPSEQNKDEIVDYIPGLSPTKLSDLPPIFYGYGQRVFTRARMCFQELSKAQYLLLTSAYELEPKAIDFLESHFDFPVYPVGPSIPFTELSSKNNGGSPDYIQWLDLQPESSVLYISQGSFLSVSDTQMDEIVAGVRNSSCRFMWVARDHAVRLKESLSNSRGLVVSWCDQLRVLCHRAVGGFWTHCGFNSTLEGVYAGVPMLTFPLFWDQILGSKMIVEDWRVGWRIKKSDGEDLVKREEIAEMVKRFMDPGSEEAKDARRRARELGEICRGAFATGGLSEANLGAFIRDITRVR